MKTCTKCRVLQPLAEFSRDRIGPDGLSYNCKSCAKAKSAAWRTANPERAKASQAAWRAANPERKKASNAAWYAANSESVKAWYAANRESVRAQDRSRRYGISHAEYLAMIVHQRGLCAICELRMTTPHVDHDHAA